MDNRVFHLAAGTFDAARRLEGLPRGHRAHRLHGHCFAVRVRAELPSGWGAWSGSECDDLAAALGRCLEPLDAVDLNSILPMPGDAELARWIAERLAVPGLDTLSISSRRDRGVVLDRTGNIQVWHRFRFESAHWLPQVPLDHPCGRMHGHGFRVCLYVAQSPADRLAELTADRLSLFWAPLQARLHHRCLNEISGLENPTSEHLARWIWDQLKPDLTDLMAVQVEETDTAGCSFDGQCHRIWKDQRFEAALRLDRAPTNDGRWRLHGHSYLIRLHLTAPLDPLLGWTIDYRDVKRLFKPLYDQLDHQRLDELPGLAAADPVHLLHWIRAELAPRLPALDRIDLYPTPDAGVALCWGETNADAMP